MNANCLKGISLLIVLLFAVQQVSFCQRTDKLVLKFVPLALIDPYGSNIQLGAEAFTGKNWSLEADFAVYSPDLKQSETPMISDRKGFKIKPEIRHYLKALDENGILSYGFYLSGEVFFVRDHFKRGDTFIRSPGSSDPQDLFFDYDIINRFELGSNFKIGHQWKIGKSLALDWFTGLGIKYINSHYEYEVPYAICCPVIRFFEPPTGKGIRPQFTFGLKLGIVFSSEHD